MSYYGRDFWAELQIQSYCIFKAPIWTTVPESSVMAPNNELLVKPQSLLQYVSKKHTFAEQCYTGLICFTREKGLSFQHEFEFSGEPAVRKKI